MTARDRRSQDLSSLKREIATIDLTDAVGDVRCIPTGVVAFDLAMGGGWPEGRISELGGQWQSGKSLLAYQSIIECQRLGGIVFLDDAERAFDKRWAAKLGINMDELFYFISESLEDGFEHLEKVARAVRELPSFKDTPVLYIKDSLEASIAKDELEMNFSQGGVGLRARSISRGLRRLNNTIANQRIAVVFINQLRTKIGVMFGPTEETAGGHAPKYYAGLRVALKKGSRIKKEARVVGFNCALEVIKSKIGIPFKEIKAEIYFDRGFPKLSGLLDFLVLEGVVKKPTVRSYQFGEQTFRPQDFPALWQEKQNEFLTALTTLTEPSEAGEPEENSDEG